MGSRSSTASSAEPQRLEADRRRHERNSGSQRQPRSSMRTRRGEVNEPRLLLLPPLPLPLPLPPPLLRRLLLLPLARAPTFTLPPPLLPHLPSSLPRLLLVKMSLVIATTIWMMQTRPLPLLTTTATMMMALSKCLTSRTC